jgi:hypothetical protein
MFLRFLNFLRESPFIEGMGRIFDFAGVMRKKECNGKQSK